MLVLGGDASHASPVIEQRGADTAKQADRRAGNQCSSETVKQAYTSKNKSALAPRDQCRNHSGRKTVSGAVGTDYEQVDQRRHYKKAAA